MKVYLKKVAIVMLVFAIIISSLPMSAFRVFGKEVDKETTVDTNDIVIISDEQKNETSNVGEKSEKTKVTEPVEKEETVKKETVKEETTVTEVETKVEEEKTEEKESEDTTSNLKAEVSEKTLDVEETKEKVTEDKKTTEDENSKSTVEENKESLKSDSKVVDSDNSKSEISEEITEEEKPFEANLMMSTFALERESEEESEEDSLDGDFIYYFESDKDTKLSCSKSELNGIIANATEKMYIEMNKDVTLDDSMTFAKANSYELDLKGKSLTIVEGKRMIVVNSANITVKNGTLTGAKANTGDTMVPKRGAVFNSNRGTLILENLTISNNYAGNQGGVIYAVGGTVTVKNCNFKNNESGNFGGVARFESRAKAIFDNCTMTGNIANTSAGADIVYANNSEVELKGCAINNNGRENGGSLIYASGNSAIVTISENTEISNNNSKDIILIRNYANYKVINCKIINNNNNGHTIYTDSNYSGGTCELNNCLISNNKSGCYFDYVTITWKNVTYTNNLGGIYVKVNSTITLEDSLIAGNREETGYSGGIYGYNGCEISLKDTIIRNNIGNLAGGLYINGANGEAKLTVEGGAIYNNEALSAVADNIKANDVYVFQYPSTSITLPKVESMTTDEQDKTFEKYYWQYYCSSDNYSEQKIKDPIVVAADGSSRGITRIYNVSDLPERDIAEVEKQDGTTEIFVSLSEAIESAQDGETVRLIAGNDGRGNSVSEAITVSNKSITIDLNEKSWSSNNENASALTLGEGANVKINGAGNLTDINYANGSLELNSSAKIGTIYLGADKVIKTGAQFQIEETSEELVLVLSDEAKEKIETEDVKIIETETKLSDEILSKLSIKDLNSYISIKVDENDDVYVHKLKGIFLNGESGDDSNTGLSVDSPVKTFEKAKELLNDNEADCIWVTGSVTVDDSEIFELPEGTSLKRYSTFKGYLVNVNGELTLNNIIIDGDSVNGVEAEKALIKVNPNAKLNIEDGTKLINNYNLNRNSNYYEAGGAVYCRDGYVKMSGGEISGNTSVSGAGVEIYGSDARMDLNGGSINNNKARTLPSTRDIAAQGAGITVMHGASLTMNGGEVSNNDSSYFAGGIMVGSYIEAKDDPLTTFVMNGGKISGNYATDTGGGIFVQQICTATLNAGEITNNSCHLGGGVLTFHYGGGGIYVNGGKHGYEDGKLYIPNAYISDNTARLKNGAAIAGCGTSTINIYPETATIYNNHGVSQIYVDNKAFNDSVQKSSTSISQIAVGEGVFNWTEKNKRVSYERLHESLVSDVLNISDDEAENLDIEGNLSPVKITGNVSGTMGGGIGSNGFVQIGQELSINIDVNKIWQDGNNAEGLRPEEIKINLFANGKLIETKTVTEADDWKCNFGNLPKYEKDNKIEYTISEEEIEGYTTKIDNFEITNLIETSVEVTKTWVDDDDIGSRRPESVIIHLYKNGVEIDSVKLTADNEWKYTFEGLEKYDKDNNLNVYTVTEDEVDGYKTEIDGFHITNTYVDFGVLGDHEEEEDPSNEEKPSVDTENKEEPEENVETENKEEKEEKVENEKTNNVQTGDNIGISITLFAMAVITEIVVIRVKKKE